MIPVARLLLEDSTAVTLTELPPDRLYSGKWVPEEEAFVEALTEEFLAGTLSIPEGTSLRVFLGVMLGCKPKRVSKKYERKTYHGKALYARNRAAWANLKDSEERQAKLKALEKKFRESRAALNAHTNTANGTYGNSNVMTVSSSSGSGSSNSNQAADTLISLGVTDATSPSASTSTSGLSLAQTNSVAKHMLHSLLQRSSASQASPAAATSSLSLSLSNTAAAAAAAASPELLQTMLLMQGNPATSVFPFGSSSSSADSSAASATLLRQHLLNQQLLVEAELNMARKQQQQRQQQEQWLLQEVFKRKLLMAAATATTTTTTTTSTSRSSSASYEEPAAKRFRGQSREQQQQQQQLHFSV